jgi:hypothetical protein
MLLKYMHSICAQHGTNLSESIVPLDVTLSHLKITQLKYRTMVDFLSPFTHMVVASDMHYNELKLLVLRVLSDRGLADSSAVAAALGAAGVELDLHAIRMALMRYYKQGLLQRERRLGVYAYALSERGVRRLEWLESTAQKRGGTE